MKHNFGGSYWWQMNEGVRHHSSTSDFSHDCMNEKLRNSIKVTGYMKLRFREKIQSLEWNSNTKIGGSIFEKELRNRTLVVNGY